MHCSRPRPVAYSFMRSEIGRTLPDDTEGTRKRAVPSSARSIANAARAAMSARQSSDPRIEHAGCVTTVGCDRVHPVDHLGEHVVLEFDARDVLVRGRALRQLRRGFERGKRFVACGCQGGERVIVEIFG